MSDLDLTGFMKEGSIVDLDWLNVDEEEYRRQDTLPRQNLDMAPDLEALWAHDDKPASAYLVPNGGAPRTMGDMSEAHGKLATDTTAVVKVARMALMQSADGEKFKTALSTRFDGQTLKASRSAIAGVLAERGLLGLHYIDSADFPDCHRSPKPAAFVKKFASQAKWVKAKEACQGCMHAQQGGTTCSVFHKQIVVDVPYTDEMATTVEASRKHLGYSVEASQGDAKRRIKLAMLAPQAPRQVPLDVKPIVNPVQFLHHGSSVQEVIKISRDVTAHRVAAETAIETALLAKRITAQEAKEAYQMAASYSTAEDLNWLVEKVASLEAPAENVYAGQQTAYVMPAHQVNTSGLTVREVVKTASKYMNEGLYGGDLLSALKRRFDPRDLVASAGELKSITAEQGLQGIYYVDPSVYSDYGKGCHEAERLHRSRLVPYVKLGSACSSCVHNRGNRCSKINKPLVVEPPYVDKVAQQRQILATGPAGTTAVETIIGVNPVVEYGLRQAGDIEVDPEMTTETYTVDLGRGQFKL